MKLTKILTLTLIVSVLFCNFSAFAFEPWDRQFTIYCQGESQSYTLSKMTENLSQEEKEERKIHYANKWQIACEFLEMGLPPKAVLNYLFYGISPILSRFEEKFEQNRKDATFKFCPEKEEKFLYTKGVDGVKIDWYTLLKMVCQSHKKIQLPLKYDRAKTVDEIKQFTAKKSTFSTYYNPNKPSRCHNLALALKKINGTVLEVGETFSFNKIVGERSEKQGFQSAKIIVNGRYVDGIGGGVCQVSTTLYNAVLYANLNVKEVHPHSLVPLYVSAGRDAMVSYGAFDFQFENDTQSPLYIVAFCQDGRATVEIYGMKNAYDVEISTQVERTPYDTKYLLFDKTKTFDEQYVQGSDGVKSKTYVIQKKGEKILSTTQVRSDSYRKVDCIYPIDVVLG